MKKLLSLLVLFIWYLPVLGIETVYKGGLYYSITEDGDYKYATVIQNPSGKYEGDFTIPRTIQYNGNEIEVRAIGEHAFSGCSIGILDIPPIINEIQQYAFYQGKIKSLLIHDQFDNIGYSAFLDCDLENLEFVDYDFYLFLSSEFEEMGSPISVAINIYSYGQGISLPTLIIPEYVNTINRYAFYNCNQIETVVFESSQLEIREYAFYNCNNIECIDFNGIHRIEEYAFNSSNLKYINIFMSVGECLCDFPNANEINLTVTNGLENYCKETWPWSQMKINGGNSDDSDDKQDWSGETFPFTYQGKTLFYTVTSGINKTVSTKEGRTYLISDTQSGREPGNDVSGDLVLPEKVKYEGVEYTLTSLGRMAFAGCTDLTSVMIPSSVIIIDDEAFSGCKGLKSINIPNSVTTIGKRAFSECTGLTSIDISNSVDSIGLSAFSSCSGLTAIDIPNSVKSIGSSAFSNCSGLTAIDIPNSVNSIGSSAFSNCDGLKSVNLSNSVTTIESSTFYNCSNLTSIDIPNSVEYIGANAFSGCTSLTSLNFPNSLMIIDNDAFSNCISLTNINLPNSLLGIGMGTFSGCSGLTSINLPNSLTGIGMEAFSGCSSLTSINLPNSLGYIDSRTFEGCTGLKNIEIPNSITQIGERAFSRCSSLTNIIIPNSIWYISLSAFDNCRSLSEVIISDSDQSIRFENNTFEGTSIKYLYLGRNWECGYDEYNNYVFEGMESIEIGEQVTNIPNGAFAELSKLKSVRLPQNLSEIPSRIFTNCISLEEINLSDKVTDIGESAFEGCFMLKTMRLPKDLTRISYRLFANCVSLEKVYMPENVSYIGSHAFYNCPSLRSLNIPDGVEEIPAYMLANGSSITEILIPNSVTSINEYAFANCSALKNIDLGTGVYNIGNYAFDGCQNIAFIHSMAKNPPFAYQYTFPIESYSKATVTVQEQSLNLYKRENPWYRFNNYLTVNGAISLSHYQVDMAGNEVFQLGVYGANSEIKWTSSNPAVAYANECGLIVAMGITGSTLITAHVDGEEINCSVTVSAVKRDTKALVRTYATSGTKEATDPVEIYMEGISGNPPMLNVRLVPVGAATVIDWTSSDDELATIENGIVTIHSDGDVEFGASTENGLSESMVADTEGICGVEDITIGSDSESLKRPNDIYTLQGVLLKRNASQEDIDALAPGFYIIGGKKVLVK